MRRAIAEAERLLRPRGRLVIAEPCVPGFERLMCRPLTLVAGRAVIVVARKPARG